MIYAIGYDLSDSSSVERLELMHDVHDLFKDFDQLQRFMLDIISSLKGAECYALMSHSIVLPVLLELNELSLDNGLFKDIDRVKVTLDNATEKYLKRIFEGLEHSNDSDGSESDMDTLQGQPDSLMVYKNRSVSGSDMSGVITKRPQSTIEELEKENQELKRERTKLVKEVKELRRIDTGNAHAMRRYTKGGLETPEREIHPRMRRD